MPVQGEVILKWDFLIFGSTHDFEPKILIFISIDTKAALQTRILFLPQIYGITKPKQLGMVPPVKKIVIVYQVKGLINQQCIID